MTTATTLPVAHGETLFGDFKITLAFDNDPRTVGLEPLVIWTCLHCDAHSADDFPAAVAHARTHFPATTA
jgi:hypothetical protein